MEKKVKIIAVAALVILFLSQISALFLFAGEQIEDSGSYRDLAVEKAENNSFYPDESDEYDRFIANPGYINFLSIFYRISDNDKFPIAANIVLVMIMAFCIYFISLRLFKNKIIALMAVIFMALFPTFVGEVLNLRSEILFTTVAYASIAIVLSDIKFKYILCGILLAIANWIRPLGLVFLLAILLYMILTKVKFANFVKLVSTILVISVIIGSVSYMFSGYFVHQSVTKGINFIMGASDDADGSYKITILYEGSNGYLENYDNMTFREKDNTWTQRSIDWIRENPGKYAALIPAKLFYMYSVDTYAFSTFYNNEVKTSGNEYIAPLLKNVVKFNFKELTWVDYVVIVNQVLYMAYLMLMLISAVYMLIKKQNVRQIIFLLTLIVLGTGMTIITVGGARYHYPYLPIMFIMSSVMIHQWLIKDRTGGTTNLDQ